MKNDDMYYLFVLYFQNILEDKILQQYILGKQSNYINKWCQSWRNGLVFKNTYCFPEDPSSLV